MGREGNNVITELTRCMTAWGLKLISIEVDSTQPLMVVTYKYNKKVFTYNIQLSIPNINHDIIEMCKLSGRLGA